MSQQTDPSTIVEDDRLGMSLETLRRAVLDHLRFTRAKDERTATLVDLYHAFAHTVRDRMVHRWMETVRTYADQDVKRVYYLSAEFLLGRQLGKNLLNLGLFDLAREGVQEYDLRLEQVLVQEPDPGLGNGGLGRLAACFMDSLATLDYPAMGYGLRYEFGIFNQVIENGWQVEQPDEWLRQGNPWEIARPEYPVEVRFGGRTLEVDDGQGGFQVRWVGGETVIGIPHDMPIAGYGTDNVNTLRLWSARASQQFDLAVFNEGDYVRAVAEKENHESISKVLYPRDDSPKGKELRFKQQYFFVACSIHDILRRHLRHHGDLTDLPEKAAIQLNDTHPSIGIAELMRLLLDREGLDWDTAWDITHRTFAYTNHTLLPEALEAWPVHLFEKLLPRHLEIIYEINHRFLRQVHVRSPRDPDRRRRMSLIEEGPERRVRMAHLACVGSHTINGVADLHSKLLRERVLSDFADLWPDRFTSVTNGVTPRRWLLQSNPRLSTAICRRIGRDWITDLSELQRLEACVDDEDWLEELRRIKHANKVQFAAWIQQRHGWTLDPDTLFDVHVKRIHEYKRQALPALHAVHLYARIKFHGEEIVPRTILIGGKAAPGYGRAKRIIKLIHDTAALINHDPDVNDQLQLRFLPDYDVSLAQRVIPAADLSEQVSMAGKEASGTGNMKFQMNGALTIGTLDGANIEIREAVGADNFFLFGLDAEGVREVQEQGYDPQAYIADSPALQEVLDHVESGMLDPQGIDLHRRALRYLRQDDPFLVCADFEAYRQTQRAVDETYRDPDRWWRMVARNIAHAGRFSSDRSIRDYAREIWDIAPCPVQIEG